MGKAQYRRYRSTSFDEVLGQDHITTTLKNALKSKTFAHAYLLTGPRGVGKTSVARILAFAVNNLDYSHEVNHLDIIEIDAASNRRIDEIRALRERVHIAPTSASYKVYIIDEVHMLTKEAFNALLKTLEEPPEHVIFILATTDIHKVPETIVSRCVRFTFRPIETSAIVEHLASIAKQEKLDITKDALQLIAEHARGSFRDSISLLEQIKNMGGTIELESVESMLGLAPEVVISAIVQGVQSGNLTELTLAIQKAYDHGTSEAGLAKQLSEYIRGRLIANELVFNKDDTLKLLHSLLLVPGSVNSKAELELALVGLTIANAEMTQQLSPTSKVEAPKLKNEKEPSLPEPVPAIVEELPIASESVAPLLTVEPQEIEAAPTNQRQSGQNLELWPDVLSRLKGKYNTLYGIARMAEVSQDGDEITLIFKFAFHHKQMNDPKSKAILSKLFTDAGCPDVLLVMSIAVPGATQPAPKTDELSSISNIFGSHEVLES